MNIVKKLNVILTSNCDQLDRSLDTTIFECKVDGKTWKTSCESKDFFGCTASDFKYYTDIPDLTLRGDKEDQNSSLVLNVKKQKLKKGENKLFIDNFIGTYFGDGNNNLGCETFKLDTLSSFSFNISELDTIKLIIKSRFHFNGKDKCNKCDHNPHVNTSIINKF